MTAIEAHHDRAYASALLSSVFRDLFNHPDWSQLHDFFTKRYAPSCEPSTSEEENKTRTLAPPATYATPQAKKPKIVDFRTDVDSIGLPPHIPERLSIASRIFRLATGPDPLYAAIAPAIGMAVGPGAYMDLLYKHRAPGGCLDGETISRRNENHKAVSSPTSAKRDGCGRSWDEWAHLCAALADWLYEHDAAWLEMGVLDTNRQRYKHPLQPEEQQRISLAARVPREYLATDTIDAADAVRDVFRQLADQPLVFQGSEWGFLKLEVPVTVSDAFYARFGTELAGAGREGDRLGRLVDPGKWYNPDYSSVGKRALKACPDTYRGSDWEAWLLSIEGGDVVVVRTLFQVSKQRNGTRQLDAMPY